MAELAWGRMARGALVVAGQLWEKPGRKRVQMHGWRTGGFKDRLESHSWGGVCDAVSG